MVLLTDGIYRGDVVKLEMNLKTPDRRLSRCERKMKLHWSPRSPFVRKVMIVCHETGLVDRLSLVRTVVAMKAVNKELLSDNPLEQASHACPGRWNAALRLGGHLRISRCASSRAASVPDGAEGEVDGAPAARSRRWIAGSPDPVAQRARAGASGGRLPRSVPHQVRRHAGPSRAGRRRARRRRRSASGMSRSAAACPTSTFAFLIWIGAAITRGLPHGMRASRNVRRSARPRHGRAEWPGRCRMCACWI